MNCPKCGQQVNPGDAYCGNCGQPLQGTPQPISPSPPPSSSPQSPIAQIMANQVTGPPPSAQFSTPMTATAGGAPAPIQVAAVSNKGEKQAIIGLILGIIGLPAAIVPIIGLILGIVGLILGATARSHYKHTISMLAIIFSAITVVVALGLWIVGIEQYVKTHKDGAVTTSNSSASSSSSAALQGITTPCYSVQIDGGLNSYKPNGCDFDSANTREEYTVEGTTNATLTSSNLPQVGQQALTQAATAVKGTSSGGHSTTFAGSPAYVGYINAPNTQKGIFGIVLHSSSTGQNVFIVSHFVRSSTVPGFGSLETNWVWGS